ncbi:MAG: restriction endonuclease subunit S [Methylotenera sp.]
MISDWQTLPLGKCLDKVVDNRGKTPPLSDVDTPFGLVEINAIVGKNKHPDFSVVRKYVSKETYLTWFRAGHPSDGDVLFSTVGSIAEIAIVAGGSGCIAQNLVGLRADAKILDPDYLYYFLANPVTQAKLRALDISSVQPSIKVPHLLATEIRLPNLIQQKNVVAILSALDNRIALLHETNATLEALAQAMFKSWFVDFDPVHAKQQGRAPEGMDEATAALFPDGFEESDLGLVPRGWHLLPFTDTIKVIGGGTPKTSMPEFWDGDIPWFSVVDAPTITDVFVIDTVKHISLKGLNSSSTKLLAEGTTIISARGTVGRLALVGREMAMNQSCYGLQGKAEDAYFTYFSTYRLVESLKQRSHGSVFDTITTETMKGVSVIYPTANVINAFEAALNPVMSRIRTNLEQAQTLGALRDTLLPRLISGQLRLPEAEVLLEEVH